MVVDQRLKKSSKAAEDFTIVAISPKLPGSSSTKDRMLYARECADEYFSRPENTTDLEPSALLTDHQAVNSDPISDEEMKLFVTKELNQIDRIKILPWEV